MTSADFPWFWHLSSQSDLALPAPMVLCIEECLHAQSQSLVSTTLLVLLDGKHVSGGSATEFPSRVIFMNPGDMSARLQFLLVAQNKAWDTGSVSATEGERSVDVSFKAELSITDMISFGSPLYTSLWLGLAHSRQDASLCSCLLRARCPDAPKIKITMFATDGSGPHHRREEVSTLPRPNVRRTLDPSADEDRSCFGVYPLRENWEIAAAVQCVEGLIRCVDESNNMVGDLHRCMHAQVVDLQTEQVEEQLRQLKIEHARCFEEKQQAQQNHTREVLQKNEDIDTLQMQLQQFVRQAERTIRKQQETIRDLEVRMPASTQAQLAGPAEQFQVPSANARTSSRSLSPAVTSAAQRQSARALAHLCPPSFQPRHPSPALLTRTVNVASFSQPYVAAQGTPISEPAALSLGSEHSKDAIDAWRTLRNTRMAFAESQVASLPTPVNEPVAVKSLRTPTATCLYSPCSPVSQAKQDLLGVSVVNSFLPLNVPRVVKREH